MKTNDYVKYVTQTVVKYIDQPKEERKKLRQEKKEQKASPMFRWFGIIPYLLMMTIKEKKNHHKTKELKLLSKHLNK